jgi:hypothetical protein
MLLAERSIICIYYSSITISITCIVEAIDCTLTVSTLIGHLVFGLETLVSLLCGKRRNRDYELMNVLTLEITHSFYSWRPRSTMSCTMHPVFRVTTFLLTAHLVTLQGNSTVLWSSPYHCLCYWQRRFRVMEWRSEPHSSSSPFAGPLFVADSIISASPLTVTYKK